jgi:hypothetical protein
MLKNSAFLAITLVLALALRVHAFGPQGHQLVGDIADQLLKGTPTETKVKALLHDITLAEAAKIADDIKHWDGQPTVHLPWTQDEDLCDQMREFLEANSNASSSHGHNPDHHEYHYTDISVNSDLKYDKHKAGARKDDVVRMISYCIGVLKGTVHQPNSRKITPAVAVILLAHYVGDMHQPLHVGAAYFDDEGKLVDPDAAATATADKGGNMIQFLNGGAGHAKVALHAYWDGESVKAAISKIKTAAGSTGSQLSAQEIRDHFVTKKPTGHPLDDGVALKDLSTTWANEIMPTAKEAHERLKYAVLNPHVISGKYEFFWSAEVKPGNGSYREWAGDVVDTSIHKAGWRLATLLEKAM